ncbi:uncharacterized protein LOC121359864 [Pyrgilauda ruficollis]|uniref:uncharacterized protein LOC121359864 n=1 Tax=Pyrgilauda ruficollis TaxID=221976 RepID=UPI001B86C8B5|nr:uncharacterized protein LOC121359864 [Pyrgilauda ruficollis]
MDQGFSENRGPLHLRPREGLLPPAALSGRTPPPATTTSSADISLRRHIGREVTSAISAAAGGERWLPPPLPRPNPAPHDSPRPAVAPVGIGRRQEWLPSLLLSPSRSVAKFLSPWRAFDLPPPPAMTSLTQRSSGLVQRRTEASRNAAAAKERETGGGSEDEGRRDEPGDDEKGDSKETRLTLMEEVLLLGLKDRELDLATAS